MSGLRSSAVVLVSALAVTSLGGCTAQKKADSPIGTTNKDRAHVVNFPDGFPNVSTKCSGIPGKRIWVTSDGGAVTIEEDEGCGGGVTVPEGPAGTDPAAPTTAPVAPAGGATTVAP